jgi:hypothetical protein
MTFDDIYKEWEQDGAIRMDRLSTESANIPSLHNKYYRMYLTEGLRLKKLRAEYKQLVKLKTEYYKGELDSEELKEHGWPPQQLKILRQDIPTYLDADSDLITKSLKIGLVEANVEYLESIIRQINNRGYQIKNIIDFERFKSGS